MSNSNEKILRKKLAQECADEIMTINVEIESLVDRVTSVDFKSLKRLNRDKLKSIRNSLQDLKSRIKNANYYLDTVEKVGAFESVLLDEETGQQVVAKNHELIALKDNNNE